MAQPSGRGQGRADLSTTGVALARLSALANLSGALIVYLYLQFLAPDAFNPHRSSQGPLEVAVVFVVYLAVTLSLGILWMRPAYRAGFRVAQGTPLTEAQRRTVLRVPRQVAYVTAGGWAGAAVVFGIMNAAVGNPAAVVVHVPVGILLGGLVTTAITYLLVERRCRPLLMAALDGQPREARGGAIRARLLLAWVVGSAVPLAAVGLTPFEHRGTGVVSVAVSVAVLAGIGLLAGYVVTSTTAASVSEPLASVRRALNAVRGGDLSAHVEVDDPGEIGLLQADVNRMVTGLRERQQLQDLFGRHVGEAVARRALEQGPVELGGTQTSASVLFVDLLGSTALAATCPPDELVTMLNRFFGYVVEAVDQEGGWVNKFEGDGALCIFGAPVPRPDHAAAVLRAARRLRRMLADASTSEPTLDAGIGVAGGMVVAGNVGAVDRYEYTVIGDPVNEAARLSELAKSAPERLLASGDVVAAAGDEAVWWRKRSDEILRGRQRPTTVMVPLPVPSARGQADTPVAPRREETRAEFVAEKLQQQPPLSAANP